MVNLTNINPVKTASNYNSIGNIGLLHKFNEMPFYHQIHMGKFDGYSLKYIDALNKIFQTGELLSNSQIEQKELTNTHLADELFSRDNYVYLTLGTVKNPRSGRQVTIEVPNKLIDRNYPKSFVCNDLIAFDPQKFITNELTAANEEEYKNSIIKIDFGIEFLSKFCSYKFQDHKDFLDLRQYGNFGDIVNYDLSYDPVFFNPEFLVEDSLCLVDPGVKFHLVGYDKEIEVSKAINYISKTNKFDPSQIVHHINEDDFQKYLLDRSGL